jgi:hypothetical protein
VLEIVPIDFSIAAHDAANEVDAGEVDPVPRLAWSAARLAVASFAK